MTGTDLPAPRIPSATRAHPRRLASPPMMATARARASSPLRRLPLAPWRAGQRRHFGRVKLDTLAGLRRRLDSRGEHDTDRGQGAAPLVHAHRSRLRGFDSGNRFRFLAFARSAVAGNRFRLRPVPERFERRPDPTRRGHVISGQSGSGNGHHVAGRARLDTAARRQERRPLTAGRVLPRVEQLPARLKVGDMRRRAGSLVRRDLAGNLDREHGQEV